MAWTSDASGDVSGNPFTVRAGYLVSVKIVPAYFVSVPTTAYDVYLRDEDEIDLLAAAGVNQSITEGELITFSPAIYFPGGELDVVVANAGNAKTGRVDLIVL